MNKVIGAAILITGLCWSSVSGAVVLAHFERQCIAATMCSGGASTTGLIEFVLRHGSSIVVSSSFGSGATDDVTFAAPASIASFFASGSLSTTHSIEIFSRIVGGGGSGVAVSKNGWLTGSNVMTASAIQSLGYDVTPVNGIDLAANPPVTHVRFQLLRLTTSFDPQLNLAEYSAHYRFEFLNLQTSVAEPATLGLAVLGLVGLGLAARQRRTA